MNDQWPASSEKLEYLNNAWSRSSGWNSLDQRAPYFTNKLFLYSFVFVCIILSKLYSNHSKGGGQGMIFKMYLKR